MAQQISLAGGSPEDEPPLARYERLELDKQLGNSVWLAHADGEPVTARVATAAFEPDVPGGTAIERTATVASLRSPHLVPLLGVAERHDTTWLVSAHVDGVPLSRLLGAATLTPVQAGYIAVRLFQGLAVLHGWGTPHGRVTAANVVVGLDGEPRLTDWALAPLAHARGFEEAAAEDLAGARGLVAGLARNADRPVVRRHTTYDALMAELERMARADDGGDAAGAAARLEVALLASAGDATSMAGTRSEIGALVAMLVRRGSGNHDHVATRPRAPVPVPELFPAGPLSEADFHRARHAPWLRRGLVALAVLTVLGGGYAVAAKPAANLVDRVLGRDGTAPAAEDKGKPDSSSRSPDPGKNGSTGPAAEAPDPVPTLAPEQAGDVSAVDIQPVAACAAGRPCLVRATARIVPADVVREVALKVSVVNRCTGRVRTRPAGTVTAQPGWTYVFVTSSVPLPRAPSLAAVAVTTSPARAASRPLLIPATGGSC